MTDILIDICLCSLILFCWTGTVYFVKKIIKADPQIIDMSDDEFVEVQSAIQKKTDNN